MEKDYCVYMHTFPNGKVYIGQTCNKPEYRYDNGNGYKGCKYLYSAIKKYGWDSIKHEILEDNLTSEEADAKEKYYINFYQSNKKEHGYNLRTGGTSGYRYNAEVRERMSNLQKGRKQSEETRMKHSEALRKYYSEHDVSEETRDKLRRPNKGQFKKGVSHETSQETRAKISKALTGRKGKALTEEQKKHLSEMLKGRAMPEASYIATEKFRFKKGHAPSQKSIETLKKKLSKTVYQYDLDGNYINKYDSLVEASKSVGLSENAVGNCVRGYSKTAGGYIWRYGGGNKSQVC